MVREGVEHCGSKHSSFMPANLLSLRQYDLGAIISRGCKRDSNCTYRTITNSITR